MYCSFFWVGWLVVDTEEKTQSERIRRFFQTEFEDFFLNWCSVLLVMFQAYSHCFQRYFSNSKINTRVACMQSEGGVTYVKVLEQHCRFPDISTRLGKAQKSSIILLFFLFKISLSNRLLSTKTFSTDFQSNNISLSPANSHFTKITLQCSLVGVFLYLTSLYC